jgi:hypothetical protein
VLATGALLVAGSAAQAGPTMTSTGNTGIGNGTQALLPIQAPVDICGNAVAAAGVAFAQCHGGAAALNPEWTFAHFRGGSATSLTSAGNTGIGNGTQVYAPVQIPVNACGNAIGVLGAATASCDGGARAEQGDRPGYHQPDHKQPDHKQPGHKQPGYGKKHSGKPSPHGYDRERHSGTGPLSGITMISAGNRGLLNGTQVLAPVQVPINICGNAISVLGIAGAQCQGGATATGQQ